MASNVSWSMTRAVPFWRHGVKKFLAGVVVVAAALIGTVTPAVASTSPTLVVVVLGAGTVTSTPAGIACPGKCTATFATGTSVLLTAAPKSGASFLGWGGSCTGAGACTVKVSALRAVAAQFSAAAKTTPPATAKYVAAAGPTGSYISFFVAPVRARMLNVSRPTTLLNCDPSGSYNDALQVLQVAVNPGGTFSSTTTQSGVFNHAAATYTYTLKGAFQAATSTSSASTTGTYSEAVKMASGTTVSCTSGSQSWSATLFREPPWQKSDIKPGDYKGSYILLSVAPGGTTMLNVSRPTTLVNCDPSGSYNDSLTVSQVAIKPNGSFSSTTSQTAVFQGTKAKFTYTFAGAFEGTTRPGLRQWPGYTAKSSRPLVGRPHCARQTTSSGRRLSSPEQPPGVGSRSSATGYRSGIRRCCLRNGRLGQHAECD